ncbi:hypothetical protein BN14_02671 [Rhizoctonia solani AG-1 IB]|uniref:Uncharacterized protein n=1 Tax=Thanatephorus cucumeris (strain AG1-IB / isolate 7/3/14) TaxID=1108050 RepID=M5BMC7_THACB|nr:hypothetical protein BN14_02671 [Rhizoctonia solani AG-1 IB]
MPNRSAIPIIVARRRQEDGEFDDELDEDGEGPRSDLDHRSIYLSIQTTTQTPAPGPKISTGKTPTIPLESMTAFLEEMKTVKLKSRVGPTPKASVVKVEEEDDDDVGNNTFAFRRPRGPPISPRALRATNSLSSNGSSSGLGFAVKLRKTESGAALLGDKIKRPTAGTSANSNASFSLPATKRKRPEAEPQSVLQSAVRRRINGSGSGSVSLDATAEREVPTPSLCSDTTELEVDERALRTPPVESSKQAALSEHNPNRSVETKPDISADKPSASTSSKPDSQTEMGRSASSTKHKAASNKSEKPRSKSKASTSPVEETLPTSANKSLGSVGDKSIPVPEDTSISVGNKTTSVPGEKSIRAAASQRRRFVPVFAAPSAPPPTSATTPAPASTPAPGDAGASSAQATSSSSTKTREKLQLDTSAVASTPPRKSALSSITSSSPLPRPNFSAKKPRAPRLFTPQRREVIVVDDSDEEAPKNVSPRRGSSTRQRKDPNNSDSDDPLAFTSTPAPGSKNTRSSKPEWDLNPAIMEDLSFRSLFPNSDDEDLESNVYTGSGTRSKTAGFLKGGGAGGRAVWAGAGTVEGADEPDSSTSDSRRRR